MPAVIATALLCGAAAQAADLPPVDPAKLGPAFVVMSPPLPPSRPARNEATPSAKKTSATTAASRPSPPAPKPLIPPATFPAKLDPPAARGSLPLETDLQPLEPSAPQSRDTGAAAQPPSG